MEGYVSTWRASGVMGATPHKNVESDTRGHLQSQVFAWPQIQDEPTRERADGRFVKAFPLVFLSMIARASFSSELPLSPIVLTSQSLPHGLGAEPSPGLA